jgi:hypothetical protein
MFNALFSDCKVLSNDILSCSNPVFPKLSSTADTLIASLTLGSLSQKLSKIADLKATVRYRIKLYKIRIITNKKTYLHPSIHVKICHNMYGSSGADGYKTSNRKIFMFQWQKFALCYMVVPEKQNIKISNAIFLPSNL